MIKLGVPLLVLFSGSVFGANESVFLGHGKQYEIPTPSFSERQCGSIICKERAAIQTVPSIGDIPEREPNDTLDTIGSAIYFIGELGFAENLNEPNYRVYPSN